MTKSILAKQALQTVRSHVARTVARKQPAGSVARKCAEARALTSFAKEIVK